MAKPRILIVDDEPEVVELIGRLMAAEGFEVLSAYDGIGALDIVSAEKPNLVLLDVMMPMMSGFEVCEQIKADPDTQHVPVICITSAHMPSAHAESLKAGASTTLTKPFMPQELVAQVKRHMRQDEP